MRTLFHRLGAGALLASATILGGCLSADKPIVKNRDNNAQRPTTNTSTQPGAGNTQPTANNFGPKNPTDVGQPNNFGQNNTNTGTNNFRTNNSVNTPVDPTARIGMSGGPVNPAVNTTAGNQPAFNGVQPAGGFNANTANTDLRPIGTNVTNSNAIKPVTATNVTAVTPPPDPPPTNNPMPVSLQGSDRDALRSGPAGLR